jgi:hypothetical protein
MIFYFVTSLLKPPCGIDELDHVDKCQLDIVDAVNLLTLNGRE